MDNPKPLTDSLMTIFRGNGVKVVGVLLACLLFTGFVAHWALMQLISSKDDQITRLEKTVEGKDKEIEFFKTFIIDDSKNSRLEMKQLRERNESLLDSLVRFTNNKNDRR